MKRLIILILLFAFYIHDGQAQIVAWNLKGATGSETTSAANIVVSNVETPILSRGSGVAASAATDSFASTWPLIAEQNENCYYEFTVKAKNGYAVSLSTIDVKLRVQTNGPKMYVWKYSLDGGANFNNIGTPYTLTTGNFDFSNNDGVQQPTVNLSGINELQNIPANRSVIFRIYAWQSGNATSGFRIGKSLTTSENALAIGGTVTEYVAPPQIAIAAWQTAAAVEGSHPSTTNHPNIETAVLSRGPALVYNNSSTFSYTSTWPTGQDKVAAKATGAYYQATIQAKSGYYVSLSTLDTRVRRSAATVVNTYRWTYSLDGVNFIDIGPGDVVMTKTAADDTNGDPQPTIDLSGIPDLQYVPSNVLITFRMYAWGGTVATANFGFGKSHVNATNTDYNTLEFKGNVVNSLPSPLVHFVTNGGNVIDDLHPTYNTTITAPTNPVRAGYTFAGWYKEAALVNLWNFATDVVKTEINLYAKWNPILYNVTFNSDGGTAVSPIQAYYNDKINEPLTPTKSGYVFGGWYKEAALTNPWNFSTDVIQGDVTLYAKWNNPAQSISFGQLENKVYGDAPFVLNAVASSGLAIVYEALTPNISINGNVATIVGTGIATIRATQPGNSFYNPAAPIEVSFTISKASQTITFAQVGPYSRYIGTVTLKATSSSGLPVSFVASEPTVAEINGAMLNVKGLGSIAVTASQAGNEYYLAAEPVTRTIVIHTGGPLQLLASQGLSPNGDGINDVFIVEGIKSFEENQVRIMNSGGIEVFNKKGYDNQTIVFNGKTNKGEKLPAGTYYYMIEVRQGQTWLQKKGYLVLRY